MKVSILRTIYCPVKSVTSVGGLLFLSHRIIKFIKINFEYLYKMKKKTGFNLRSICGEKIIVAEGKENIDFSNIISMNETSAFLWEKAGDSEFTPELFADMLTSEYEVDHDTALADAKEIISLWQKAGIIEA